MGGSRLTGVTLVGHSTGGGEIVRYIGRHGTDRVAKLILVSAVPPLMLQTEDNPEGLPISVFDGIRAGEASDRSQLYRDLADGPFFGHNRGNDVIAGATLTVYEGGAHGLPDTDRDRLHADLLAFIQS
ncbi:MAG TPA: alpha/beta hydrolase [Microbacterium sp.]|nr:alpha/beta hydrolase [Microbacterium sp.]